jgi:hypothetical protein
METLGAFLLRSGLLTRDSLASALDRQVVYGGWLDTALLELGLTDEATMAETLSNWAGYPVCSRGWLEGADEAAVAALPATLAVSYVVAPFAVSPEGLWLAVTAPVDVDALAQLAASIGRPVLPHVATEHRIRTALRALYRVEQDPRFEELAAALATRVVPVDVEAAPADVAQEPVPEAVVVEQQGPFVGDVIQPSAAPAVEAPPPPVPEEPSAAPMDFVEALAHLTAANDREAIVAITLRYAVQAFQCAAFLGVLKGQAVVWAARVRGQVADEGLLLKGVTFPLDERNALRTVVETRAPSLGKPQPGARAGSALPERLLRGMPRAMLLQPIMVSGRVVAVLYGDNGKEPIRTKQASEVLAFASRVGLAFENLIREKRARALSAATPPPPAPEPEPTPAETMLLANAAVGMLAQEADAAVLVPSTPPQESWVAMDRGGPDFAPPEAPPASAPTEEAWVVQAPRDVQSLPPVYAAHAEDDEEPDEPHPSEQPVSAEDVGMALEEVPPELEPLQATSETLFVQEPAPTAPPAAWETPQEVPMEVAPPEEEPAPAPARPAISPEAQAIAAAALARLRSGELDEDDDEDEEEKALVEDTSWTDAVQEALTAQEGEASAPAFAAPAQDNLVQHIEDAARQAGTLEKPAYQPLPEDDDEEEPAASKEELVVFAEVGEDANATAFAAALSDTIAQGHQGGEAGQEGVRVFAEEDARGPVDEAGWEHVIHEAAEDVAAQRRSQPPALPLHVEEAPPVLHGAELPPVPVEQPLIDAPRVWTDALLSGVPDRVVVAQQKLLELGEAAAPVLTAAFPGRIAFDPFGPDASTPDPATLSPLLDLLSRMGMVGLQVALPHLDSRFPVHRYLATLLLARTYHPASIPYLLRRLHDDEPRIRRLAGDALASYVAEPGFEQVLRHLRTRVTSVVPEGRRRAIHFLGRFRDVGSIPALIGGLRAKEAEIGQEAANALHAITLQSFGGNDRKWIAWWEKNKMRSRIEWLIDALKDGDVEVRARAGAELSALTRDTFGFKADAPRKEREAAVKRWDRWWADERARLTQRN